MSVRLGLLFATLVLLLGPTVVYSQGPVYGTSFFEGTRGPTLVTDCTADKRGDTGMLTTGNLKFSPQYGDFPPGTTLKGIEVINLKTTDKGSVAKSSGGIGQSYVWFDMKSVKGHGIKFQYKMWGTVPAGTQVKVHTGWC